MFATSRQLGRIPVIAITGLPGSGKTTFLNRLLHLPELARTVVLTTTGENKVAFDHERVLFLPPADFVSESGCLCCDMRSALGDTLRELFLKALAKKIPSIDRVIIETPAIDPAQLKFTLRHAPFLGQRYVYQGTFFVLDVTRVAISGLSKVDHEGISHTETVVLAKNDLIDISKQNQMLEELRASYPVKRFVRSDQASQVLMPII